MYFVLSRIFCVDASDPSCVRFVYIQSCYSRVFDINLILCRLLIRSQSSDASVFHDKLRSAWLLEKAYSIACTSKGVYNGFG
ncbi:unnamed protein product [Arabidopsis halleri]